MLRTGDVATVAVMKNVVSVVVAVNIGSKNPGAPCLSSRDGASFVALSIRGRTRTVRKVAGNGVRFFSPRPAPTQ